MSRKLFEKGVPGKEESSDIDYKAPEERDIGLKLFYTFKLKGEDTDPWERRDFKSLVQTLESVIKDYGEELEPQPIIDSLTSYLHDEYKRSSSRSRDCTKETAYLTAVVQTLYNLNYADEFTMDIRDWRVRDFDSLPDAGFFLHGREDRPLTLNLYGYFRVCGIHAEYCNFNVYGWVKLGKREPYRKHCNFNSYRWVDYDVTIKMQNPDGEWEEIG